MIGTQVIVGKKVGVVIAHENDKLSVRFDDGEVHLLNEEDSAEAKAKAIRPAKDKAVRPGKNKSASTEPETEVGGSAADGGGEGEGDPE